MYTHFSEGKNQFVFFFYWVFDMLYFLLSVNTDLARVECVYFQDMPRPLKVYSYQKLYEINMRHAKG